MHRAIVSFFTALPVVGALLSGCGTDPNSHSTSSSSSSSSNGDIDPFKICAEQHVRADGVLVCDKPFDAPPYVHLPPADGVTDYVVSDCISLLDRDGNARVWTQGPVCDGMYVDEARLHAFSIYEVTLCGDSIDGPCAAGQPDTVAYFVRFAVIDEKAFLAPFTSAAAEGKISAATGPGSYDFNPSLPVRISFGPPNVALAEDDGTTYYQLEGAIENLATDIASSTGTCMTSLASAGATNPFAKADKVSMNMVRVPSMHSPGDDEMVIEYFVNGTSIGSDMNPAWFFGPKDLITTKPLVAGQYSGIGHGTPGAIPNVTIDIVQNGGMACTP